MALTPKDIAEMLDHSTLQPYLTEDDIRHGCEVALKYGTAQGMVSVDLANSGRHCTLSVSSPGEPISKEDQKNIFKRFYRADKARAMNGSYGLGLSIAQSIAEAHKGRIWVESRNGCNTFFVQLPLN